MKKLILSLILLIAAAGGVAGYRWFARPMAEVYVTRRGTAISAVYGTVKVTPMMRMNARALVSGVIEFASTNESAVVAVGMDVKKGQLLARVTPYDLQRELARVESDWNAAEERLRLGPPSLPLLATTEAMLGRLEKLAQNQNAPISEVGRVSNEVRTLRERVQSEKVELERAVVALREQYGVLRDRQARTEIRSPQDGQITSIGVISGDIVGENSIPFVVSTYRTFLEGQINEEDVGALAPKQKAIVQLYSYPQQEFTATLRDILPAGENQRYTVLLDLDAPPANLRSGMNGEMNIILAKRENTLIIPTRALLLGRVFVVQDGVIRVRTVKTGLHSLELTEIAEGLKEGDAVVVADHDAFRPGEWVRTITVIR
jgi:RND family efflux transporter MFP subunit